MALFKKGTHWREPKPYWNSGWLYTEYVMNRLSAAEIAKMQGCKENNILYFLKKHGIKTRTISESRKIKHWGPKGKTNPMFGRKGFINPNWKGGITSERQSFYESKPWLKVLKKVWKRDKGTCQKCKYRAKEHGELHTHHIEGFRQKNLRASLSNLVLLCKKCHSFVHSKQNTEGEFLNAVL